MKINFSLLCLIIYTSWPDSSFAAGLGDITMCSPDRAKIVASIPILDISEQLDSGIKVSLASDQDVEMLGMSHTEEVRLLTILTDNSVHSKPVIRISGCADSSVSALNFILDFQWKDGRMLREYSINIRDKIQDIVEKPIDQNLAIVQRSDNKKLQESRLYVVQPGDNIWRIAYRLGRDESVNDLIDEIMRLNPHAFINNNFDLLRADVTLLLPKL